MCWSAEVATSERVAPVTGCKSFLNVRYQDIQPCVGGPLFELTPFR